MMVETGYDITRTGGTMVRRGRRDQRGIEVRGEQRYLGQLQAEVMEIVWARGPVTVREVLDCLPGDRDLAYTTVMTVMSRLADEGVLARERVGKTYIYLAARDRAQFHAALSGSIVDE